MISELRIENLGVITSACVRPGPGFTALTGETGAGKTMVLTALEMLLGGRVDAGIAEGASIEGVWEVPTDNPAIDLVQDAGGATDDGEILLARTEGIFAGFSSGANVAAAARLLAALPAGRRFPEAEQTVLYALPDNATKSTVKSEISKGGGGFNEFRFEDKKDSEEIFMHAQKNLDIRVLNDRFEWIGHDRHLIVEGNFGVR